jgi:hypothetical protein
MCVQSCHIGTSHDYLSWPFLFTIIGVGKLRKKAETKLASLNPPSLVVMRLISQSSKHHEEEEKQL